MRITSIRERPEYIPVLLTSLEEHWPACMPWIKKHMEEVLRTGGPLPDAYVAVEKGKVVLAEFGYGGTLLPTFPLDPTQARRSMWFLKATLLPWFYWNGMLKGREWFTDCKPD